MRSISTFKSGRTVIVDKIEGGQKITKRLRDLGISRGQMVKIEKNDNGNVILKVNNTKLAIGFGQASKIFVK